MNVAELTNLRGTAGYAMRMHPALHQHGRNAAGLARWIRPSTALYMLWGGGLYGALQLHRFTTPWVHSICGPWGCGGSTEALAGYHLFWLLAILPPAAWITRYLPKRLVRWGGRLALVTGLMGLAGWMGWEASQWLHDGPEIFRNLVVQRCLFVVANTIDVPLIQFILAAAIWCWVGRVPRQPATPVARPSSRPVENESTGAAGRPPAADAQPTAAREMARPGKV